MDRDEIKIKKYESALNLLFYEGEIAWQLNILFIALQVGLGTLIGGQIKDGKIDYSFLLLGLSFLGIAITILWLGTFSRNNKYYNFRMAQARDAEPENWELVRVRGYKFSNGEKVTIDSHDIKIKDKDHELNRFEKWASNKGTLKWVIYLLIVSYAMLFLTTMFNLYSFQIC